MRLSRVLIICFTLVFLFSVAFVSAAGTEEVADEEPTVTLQVATVDAVGSLRNLMGNYLVDYIEEMDDSAGITVNHIEGPVLGDAGEVMDQVAEGSVSIIGTDMAWVTPFDDDLQPTSFGFMFRSTEHFQRFFDSDIFTEISERVAQDRGLLMVSATPLPPRMFFSREPLHTAEDLEGLLVRAPELPMFIESYKAYGMSPTPISWGETFLALRTGVVDAAQGLPTDVKANDWHLAAPHITNLTDMFAAHAWVINDNLWSSLTVKQQEVLTEALEASNAWGLETAFEEEEKVIEALIEEGAIYNEDFQDTEIVRERALEHAMELEADGWWSEGMVKAIDNL